MSERISDPRLLAMTHLIQVESELRRAETLSDLFYVMVNDTKRVTGYRQAFLWQETPDGSMKLTHASNIATIDENAPLVRWLARFQERLPALLPEKGTLVKPDDLTEDDRQPWLENLADVALAVPVSAPSGHRLGMLVLFYPGQPSEGERALLERLLQAYGHAWNALLGTVSTSRFLDHFRVYGRRYVLGILVLLGLPVRLYVLAPGQVIAEDAFVVAAPLNGVIEEVHVEPNAPVAQGDALFSLEGTQLENELAVTRKALNVAQAEYLRNAQDALQCEQCRGRLPELQAIVEREQARIDWAISQLERTRVVSPEAGVAVFVGRSDLEGMPVSVGQRVMTIASPDRTRLKIAIPVDDAISIDRDAEAVFYLNIDPLASYDAKVVQSSYEASLQPDGTLAYIVEARFQDDQPRLGLRGTAKIYGGRSPIIVHILRRPLSWLRRAVGI